MRVQALLAALVACSSPSAAPPGPAPPATESATQPGEPRPSAELDKFFSTALSRWIVALNRAPGEASRPSLPRELPPAVAEALSEVLDVTEAVARSSSNDEPPALDEGVVKLNAALKKSDLPYRLDEYIADSGVASRPHVPLLFVFEVLQERRYHGRAGSEHTVYWAKRIDQLAYRYRLVGVTGKDRDPLILLGSLEELLCVGFLGRASLGSSGAGAAVAAAANNAAANIAPASRALGEALSARRQLFERWNSENVDSGGFLVLPTTRLLDAESRRLISGVLSPDQQRELTAIEQRLAALESATAYETLLHALATTTELHELQHQLDIAKPPTLAVELDVAKDPRVIAELSALLAEFARTGESAHLVLARTTPVALANGQSIERIATRAALAAILGEPANASGEELEVVLSTLAKTPPDKVAKMAAAAWRRLFGEPLAPLSLVR